MKITEVPAIKQPRGAVILRLDQIKDIVEAPLVKACEILYDKNIRTLESSGNSEDVGRKKVGIVIDFKSLSKENQRVAKKICRIRMVDEYGLVAVMEISIPDDLSADEIERRACELANSFQSQPLTWAPQKTIEEVREMFSSEGGAEFSLEKFLNSAWYKRVGWYFDENERLFYMSKEHREKITMQTRAAVRSILDK